MEPTATTILACASSQQSKALCSECPHPSQVHLVCIRPQHPQLLQSSCSHSRTCWSSISFCCPLICFPLCIYLGFYREKGILSQQLSQPPPWPMTHMTTMDTIRWVTESAHVCISTRKKLLIPKTVMSDHWEKAGRSGI